MRYGFPLEHIKSISLSFSREAVCKNDKARRAGLSDTFCLAEEHWMSADAIGSRLDFAFSYFSSQAEETKQDKDFPKQAHACPTFWRKLTIWAGRSNRGNHWLPCFLSVW